MRTLSFYMNRIREKGIGGIISGRLSLYKNRYLTSKMEQARRYVGTDEVSGNAQFHLLTREGVAPSSVVLEVGCGCLHLGIPLMGFLRRGNYVGIDPNEWLRETAMKKRSVRRLIERQAPIFLTNPDFDARSLNMKFDYAFSHSVLSHIAHWQLEHYLTNVAAVLKPNGKIIASIRLAEGNAYGSTGSADRQDSMDKEWLYPGTSWFRFDTIQKAANKAGLVAIHKPEFTQYYTSIRPDEFHDWIVFARARPIDS